jgi:ABC-type polysaccharide/polyol phosphate export permease
MRASFVWIRSVGPLALADLRHRYAGSALGGLWAIAAPLVEVGAYAVVFGALLRPAGGTGSSYALFIASGLLPWASFREALETSASTLSDNRWIRRSRVPLDLLVARSVLSSAVRAAAALVLVVAAAMLTRVPGPLSLLGPIAALALQLVASYGLGLTLAPLGTLYPDVRPALASALTLLTFASPILYQESILPPAVRTFVEWNPFTHLLRLYRAPLVARTLEAGAADLGFTLAGAAACLGVGLWVKGRFYLAARDRL